MLQYHVDYGGRRGWAVHPHASEDTVRIITLIMAGGEGGRMGALTKNRPKPALPFAGVYRLIDFPLSNCVHSGLSDVWVLEQFAPFVLNAHLANGRPWDLDRTYGGLQIIPPYTDKAENEGGWHAGNADALYRNRRAIRDFKPDLVLILSADHVYTCDYRVVIEQHQATKADLTLVTTRVRREEAHRFAVVETAADKRVTAFAYKPDEPTSDEVTTEIFVYSAAVLLDTLDELVAESGGAPEDADLKDYGDALLPRLVERGKVYAFPFDGYWRDVGVIPDYWQAHQDMLAAAPPLQLDDPAWPILTFGAQRMPARIAAGAEVRDSLIGPGCRIAGTVERSVLGPGVVVEAGARVVDSIVFNDAHIRADVVVQRAIVDSAADVAADAGQADGEITVIEGGVQR